MLLPCLRGRATVATSCHVGQHVFTYPCVIAASRALHACASEGSQRDQRCGRPLGCAPVVLCEKRHAGAGAGATSMA
eukprot:5265795-Alexandrium_andersonii.AAC.1